MGQLSLELLIVLTAYLAFLFALIVAFADFIDILRYERYESKVFAKAKGELLSVLYSSQTVNNRFQSFNVPSDGCAIFEDEIICSEVVTKRQVPALHTLRYEYEIA